MFEFINECLDKSTEAICLIYFAIYKLQMYAQLQRVHIQKYNYDVLDFIKLVKKNKIMSIIIHVKYIFCNVVV